MADGVADRGDDFGAGRAHADAVHLPRRWCLRDGVERKARVKRALGGEVKDCVAQCYAAGRHDGVVENEDVWALADIGLC
jgi:hypothetical protein